MLRLSLSVCRISALNDKELVPQCTAFMWKIERREAMADIDELKAAFEQLMQAVSSRDVESLATHWHEQIVSFQPLSPFAVDGKATQRQVFGALFDNSERVGGGPIDVHFRVIGAVGMVWGHFAIAIKPTDGPLQTTFVRS